MEAKPPLRFRKLRIAWSVVCGIACVLLIVLWWRSCFLFDKVSFGTRQSAIIVESLRSELQVQFVSTTGEFADPHYGIHTEDAPEGNNNYHGPEQWCAGEFGLGLNIPDEVNSQWTYSLVRCPHWFLAIASAIAAFIPWSKQRLRFSLRTLLIATTLVAVVLGAIVYAVR